MGSRRLRRSPSQPRPKLDLRKTLFVLPNLITLGSIFCGFNAIRLVAKDQPTENDVYRAAVLLIFAMLFDLMDGRVARMTKTQSAFGLQIDSLADVISFGVAPAMLLYKWVLYRLPVPGLLAAFLYVACAAIRLARFNVLASSANRAPVKPGSTSSAVPSPAERRILISLVVANRAADGLIGREVHLRAPRRTSRPQPADGFRTCAFARSRSAFDNPNRAVLLFVLGSSTFVWQRFSCRVRAGLLLTSTS